MKRIFTMITVLLALNSNIAQAQVPNGDFERILSDSTLANWGNVYLMAVSVDTTGNGTGDSILFDQYYYHSTLDAHSGNHAMELSNSYNVTQGYYTCGGASADTDSVFTSWSGFEIVPVTTVPTSLDFYFKYLPVNGDTGYVSLALFDSMMDPVGNASMMIIGTTAAYTFASAPITYINSNVPVYMALNFRNSMVNGQISYGTRMLIDDVILSTTTGIAESSKSSILNISPNPVLQNFLVESSLHGALKYTIYSMAGRIIKQGYITSGEVLSVEKLESGNYILELVNNNNLRHQKVFIKK